ncbi:MAG: hypothetical protein JWL94_1584 [Microbacteriaceae bacterium]|jgi:hypothetical protein|nr:hypothetical protein [Microbacteriaceae bacterium]HEV7956035.1 DUF6098 family protein [Marisediminicola sp.]
MELQRLNNLSELEELVAENPGLHVRFSEGPDVDASTGSTDTESGLRLPGLSVNTLDPELWWSRPLRDWLARQLCQYKHLQDANPERFAWLLRGRSVGRGPDSEPLLADVEAVARLSDRLLDEAEQVYTERFDAGRAPEQ